MGQIKLRGGVPDQEHDLQVAPDGTESIIIGRNMWGITQKRASREQVRVDYNPLTSKLTITQLGPNTSYATVLGDTIPIGQHQTVTLDRDSAFSLLEDKLWFYVIWPRKRGPSPLDFETEDGRDGGGETKGVARPTKRKRLPPRKRTAASYKEDESGSEFGEDDEEEEYVGGSGDEDEDDDDDMEDFIDDDDLEDDEDDSDGNKGKAKKSKKRECMYGKKCYRRNPQHFEEFAHPWLDEDQDGGGASGRRGSAPQSTQKRTSGNGRTPSGRFAMSPRTPATPVDPPRMRTMGGGVSHQSGSSSKTVSPVDRPPHRAAAAPDTPAPSNPVIIGNQSVSRTDNANTSPVPPLPHPAATPITPAPPQDLASNHQSTSYSNGKTTSPEPATVETRNQTSSHTHKPIPTTSDDETTDGNESDVVFPAPANDTTSTAHTMFFQSNPPTRP
ncbi:uncharacterized protein EV422DRAFT_523766 [Fimicolochytrium jonesii]|uniref:uncharacterized protein n=1 Tax=Fimicolochytrium jonesii TaxID=1396493 RepID=UPI0022FDDE15|nr:uncharacterized protein EV422DRAFT_523766 [Fimicolochytrium jonesii]KAI8822378.1 hypothetical protein EV422DRAFT_523766 [Fimicolochytrium jonesii]